MTGWRYVLACIAVPCLVGGVMYRLFDLWDRARRRSRSDEGLPRIDYLL